MGSTQESLERPVLRGLWVWNTLQLLDSPPEIESLFHTAQAVPISDIYLYVSPEWWDDRTWQDDLEAFNAKFNAVSVRIWALDGERAYCDNVVAEEKLLDGMHAFVEFNHYADPSARFFGFQVDIEPQDIPSYQDGGCFHNGVAMSKLTPPQRIQRDILMHKWLNVLTRASGLMRSRDIPFGAALPWWLHDYLGEPIAVPWVKGSELFTCMMDLIMPLLDQYIIMAWSTDPAQAVRRSTSQAAFASNLFARDGSAPFVLVNLETGRGVGENISYADTPGKSSKAVLFSDMHTVHGALESYQAFAGVTIHHWESFRSLSGDVQDATRRQKTADDRYSSVLQRLNDLKAVT